MEAKARFRGSMLGLAVGDALGAPVEGLKAGHIKQLYGRITGYVDPAMAWERKPWRWRLPGLYSDDTQQALALADTLVRCRGFDREKFVHLLCELARADAPGSLGAHRGTGGNFRLTLRGLLAGTPPHKVRQLSAGIGAMMRAAPAGLYYVEAPEMAMRAGIEQALVTHGDPRALVMAAAVAYAVARSAAGAWDRLSAGEKMNELVTAAEPAEMMVEREYLHELPVAVLDRLGLAAQGLSLLPRLLDLPEENLVFNQIVNEANRQFPEHKITEVGQGFVMAAGLAALFVALSARNYEEAVLGVIHLGKDTDSMAAIAGAITGARFGEEAIPEGWRQGLVNGEQVALRGEALYFQDEAGLDLRDLAEMETELTRKEAAARAEFMARFEARARRKSPASTEEKQKVSSGGEGLPDSSPGPGRRDKRSKPRRRRPPWKK